MIIVIDGPAGSGKSSTAKAVANKLNLTYIDSGALYRAVTMKYLQSKNRELFFDSLDNVKIEFSFEHNTFKIWIDGIEVTDQIRSHEVNEHVSFIAKNSLVRKFVNAYLREYVKKGAFIADGRDLSTVVFPNADLKIFMIASVEARAIRRQRELQGKGENVALEVIKSNLIERDEIDSSRDEAPLKKDTQAIQIDTSNCTFEQQVDDIIALIKKQNLN